MRFANGKIILDDISRWRSDGHSVIITDPVGATLVVPLVVLKEVLYEVEEHLKGQGFYDKDK